MNASNPWVSALRSGAFVRDSVNDDCLDLSHSQRLADEIERLTAELALEHRLAAERGALQDRLRAALERIIATESVDDDGNQVPETGAAFIAKQALTGAAEDRPNDRPAELK